MLLTQISLVKKEWIETTHVCPFVHVMCMCLQVRSRAQNVLTAAIGTYSFSYRDLIPRILQLLSPLHTSSTQQQFKVRHIRKHAGAQVYT